MIAEEMKKKKLEILNFFFKEKRTNKEKEREREEKWEKSK